MPKSERVAPGPRTFTTEGQVHLTSALRQLHTEDQHPLTLGTTTDGGRAAWKALRRAPARAE
eukprot:1837791-Alexandrium_andersonii.AAC.1